MLIEYKFVVNFQCFCVNNCQHNEYPQSKIILIMQIVCGRITNKLTKMMPEWIFYIVAKDIDYMCSSCKIWQVVGPRPQTPQGESVAKPETPLLIILGIACKYDVHGNLFSPLFEKQSPWTKTSLREMVNNSNSIPKISEEQINTVV